MWTNKISKFSLFLLLMILVHVSRAETTVEPLTTETSQQNVNEEALTAENLNLSENNDAETTTVADGDVTLVTEPPADLNNATETSHTTEDVNNNVSTTTESITEPTTEKIECVCDCMANGNQVTLGCSTSAPEQAQTETTEGKTSSINDSTLPNTETTQPAAEEETTTNSIKEETTTASDAEINTSTQSVVEPEPTTVPPPPICTTPGLQAHEQDCQQYNDCTLEGSLDGSFHLLTKSCPEKQAFNVELNRCSRDISSCAVPVQCLVKGGVADPAGNASYYLCEPRFIGIGFRIFHIDCASNEIFYPELGKCFVDLNNLPTPGFPPYNWNQIKDVDIVKAELKLLKEQDKLKLKQEKDRKKAEEKLQKELEKEAKKKAKEEEKANKEKAKLEAASIVCLQEGNIASTVAENIYYACITKKGKLKAIPMQCGFGATFNSETGTCVNSSTAGVNVSVSTEDDDD